MATSSVAQRATELVQWTGSVGEVQERSGFVLQLDAEIAEGWKMYALDSPRPSRGVELELTDLPAWLEIAGPVRQSPPKDAFDPNFRIDVRYFDDAAEFYVDLAYADSGADRATVDMAGRVAGSVTFQICNDDLGICLPPTDLAFAIPMDGSDVPITAPCDDLSQSSDSGDEECAVTAVDFSSPSAPGAVPDEAAAAASPRDFGGRRGLLPFLLLAAGAGLAALLTPCVFPMIPLTVSYFAKESGDRRQAATMAAAYGFAIVATFTGLGILMAVLVGAAGAQSIAANPWVNLFIAGVLILFALSLLGMFELRLPAGFVNYFNRKGQRAGYVGVLFMGFTITLVSFSCTAPFVGGLLAAAAGGQWFYPLVGMIAFSGAFSIPFVLLSLFPSALESLPKSGSWMSAFKVTLGFIELAAAIKFLSNADLIWQWELVSRPLAIAVTVVIFALTGLYLIGKLPLAGETLSPQIGVGRLVSGVAFFGLALYMLPGLFGAPLNRIDAYLPPRLATDMSLFGPASNASGGLRTADSGEGWIEDDIDTAMAEGLEEGKPVLIDFTGYTCTNCREMESNVFIQPQVTDRFVRNYVRLRLFTDTIEKGKSYQRYQLRLTGTVALPTYAIVEPQDQALIAKASGVMSLEEFVDFLDAGTAAFVGDELAMR
ncbi:MAG: thioredoxin family protein [Rhodothermia bacterium]|nr:thioredoxin family protein [Rhodothermia bacterium]